MTPHLPPYLAYKPSGTEWLGDVPVNWEVWRLRNIVVPDSVRVGSCVENNGIPREQML